MHFEIVISCLSLAGAKCLPGTTSPSSKYLPPVGETPADILSELKLCRLNTITLEISLLPKT